MNDKDFDSELRANIARMAAGNAARRQKVEEDALLHKPEWPYWSNMGFVRIDDAVVLSCDIDPVWHGNRAEDAPMLVRKRKTIVETHIAAKSLLTAEPTKRVSSDSGDRLIFLSDFRKWGESLPTPVTFPDQFPKANTNDLAKPLDIENELDARERTTLLNIIGALVELAGLDIGKPYKAGEFVAGKLQLKGIKIDPRTISKHLEAALEAMGSTPLTRTLQKASS